MRAVTQALFDRGGMTAAFDHVKNLVAATLIVAAGSEAVRRVDIINLPGLHNAFFAGYVVAGAGCLLILLNFIDGWRKLSTLRWHYVLQAILSVAYILFSVRIIQLIVLFGSHVC
jgi:hypothetical protein